LSITEMGLSDSDTPSQSGESTSGLSLQAAPSNSRELANISFNNFTAESPLLGTP
jgi:hypothetical protein